MLSITPPLPPTLLLSLAVFLAATYRIYTWLLPKPLPGIPYNKEATRSILGDLLSVQRHLKTSTAISDWVASHHKRHNSPIVQIWISLFQKQWVIIDDFREAQDILMRRTKEFDKPDVISDILWGVAPHAQANLVTKDAWRAQRKSVADLMAPAFLQNVAAPQLYRTFTELIALWKQKMWLAQGHAVSIKQDVYEASLEAIWSAVFGNVDMDTSTRRQSELLHKTKPGEIRLPADMDKAVEFDRPAAPAVFEAVLKLTDSIESTVKSPCPLVTGFLQRYIPSMRKYARIKDRAIAEQIRVAEEKLAGARHTDDAVLSTGVDHVLYRERLAAEKEQRAPDYYSPAIKDDLLGLLVAGHDTFSTTLLMSLKLLSTHPHIQDALRASLHAAFPLAHALFRPPTAHEIASTQNHYLDACIEECIRCSAPTSLPARTATCDTIVLGHVIPKGTRVAFVSNGAGVFAPPHAIPDSLRSASYLKCGGGKTGVWDEEGMTTFWPERWLVGDAATGKQVFDAQAGPHLQFGLGVRGCYGRKMAYVELRIAIVLAVWELELIGPPEEYNSWRRVEGLTRSPEQAYVRFAPAPR